MKKIKYVILLAFALAPMAVQAQTASDLMGLGMPAGLAQKLGTDNTTRDDVYFGDGTGTAKLSFDSSHDLNLYTTTNDSVFLGFNNAANLWLSTNSHLSPVADGGLALGNASYKWGNAFFSGTITSTANNLGWTARAGANTACNTTCTAACVAGLDSATHALVSCDSALADTCICAGAS